MSLEHTATGLNPDGRAQEIPASLFFTYQDENRTLQTLGVWSTGTASVTGSGNPEEVRTLNVSDGTLQTLAVPPLVGRWFSAAEMTPGSRDTAMLTFGYWQRRYGGDTSIIGRRVTVNTQPRTVVGVMPQRFRFLDVDLDLILPDQPDRKNLHLGAFNYRAIGRLRPGVTLGQANADMTRLVPVWLRAWPSPPGLDRRLFADLRLTPALMPLSQAVVGNVRDVLWVLLATIGLVLLIACANVANLLLVRAEGRQQELAIRAALGAGWRRIARECLLESLVLALAGGALGLGLAYAALRLLVAIGPATLPRIGEIGIDPTVLASRSSSPRRRDSSSASSLSRSTARRNSRWQLKGSGRTSSGSKERHHTRNTLVVLQVALALVLLVASGLMVRTFLALRVVEPGFRAPAAVQLVRLRIPEALIADPERVLRVQAAMLERLAAIPGVSAASFANAAPLEDSAARGDLHRERAWRDRGRTDSATQAGRAGLPLDRWHAARLRARHRLAGYLSAPARRAGLRESRAPALAHARSGARQTHPRKSDQPVARSRRRRRRRARGRHAAGGPGNGVFACAAR